MSAHRQSNTLVEDKRIEDMEDDLRFSKRPPLELRLDIAQAIRSLPEHYREVVLLRDIKEMSIDCGHPQPNAGKRPSQTSSGPASDQRVFTRLI